MPAPDSVVLETNLGNIQLELYWDHAPKVCPMSSISCVSKDSSHFQLADLRKLRTVDKAWLLQRRDIPSNYRCMHTIQAIGLLLIIFKGFYGPGR